jgi:hypothetical protein
LKVEEAVQRLTTKSTPADKEERKQVQAEIEHDKLEEQLAAAELKPAEPAAAEPEESDTRIAAKAQNASLGEILMVNGVPLLITPAPDVWANQAEIER